jgi:hypothetical protein
MAPHCSHREYGDGDFLVAFVRTSADRQYGHVGRKVVIGSGTVMSPGIDRITRLCGWVGAIDRNERPVGAHPGGMLLGTQAGVRKLR